MFDRCAAIFFSLTLRILRPPNKGHTTPLHMSRARPSTIISTDCADDQIHNPSSGRCVRLTTATGKKLLKEYREGHLTNLSVQDRAKVDAFLAGQSAARTVVPTRPATTVTTPVAQSENADTWPLPATVVDKMSMNEMETVLRRHGIRIALPRDKASITDCP